MKIQKDKIMHAIAGFIFALAICWASKSCAAALLAAVILGMLKEIFDYVGHGTVELMDVVATGAGGAIAVITYRIIIMIGG
ncbi:MAG: hypothetical protein VB076_05060 [Synergistaceae bacterium]|nr:hypothetical protein [Synergistaceae bacterium]